MYGFCISCTQIFVEISHLAEDCSLLQNVQTGSWAHPASSSMCTWVLSREQSGWGLKLSAHLHLVELHLYTSTPLYAFTEWTTKVYTGDRCDLSKTFITLNIILKDI